MKMADLHILVICSLRERYLSRMTPRVLEVATGFIFSSVISTRSSIGSSRNLEVKRTSSGLSWFSFQPLSTNQAFISLTHISVLALTICKSPCESVLNEM